VIISFRATGEGHISSIVLEGESFINNDLHVMKIGDNIDKAEIVHKKSYNKERFIIKLTRCIPRQILNRYYATAA
jgi:hypothetical protein